MKGEEAALERADVLGVRGDLGVRAQRLGVALREDRRSSHQPLSRTHDLVQLELKGQTRGHADGGEPPRHLARPVDGGAPRGDVPLARRERSRRGGRRRQLGLKRGGLRRRRAVFTIGVYDIGICAKSTSFLDL